MRYFFGAKKYGTGWMDRMDGWMDGWMNGWMVELGLELFAVIKNGQLYYHSRIVKMDG